ncbi:hypothetical protein GYMLUDRAFT_603070 [Collybiopsis luxurians FD-317 M1]|uniref:Uncharacterized protein n=1 Tax=Collybiopsis luxurians FD-317 M1 TaxID=944289 RepID=A0A0D0BX95_9AGAR|nr:hypothetical protein GYMLUDRAFT_603070 [Collybiopsis luxurians FD-317 M1]
MIPRRELLLASLCRRHSVNRQTYEHRSKSLNSPHLTVDSGLGTNLALTLRPRCGKTAEKGILAEVAAHQKAHTERLIHPTRGFNTVLAAQGKNGRSSTFSKLRCTCKFSAFGVPTASTVLQELVLET